MNELPLFFWFLQKFKLLLEVRSLEQSSTLCLFATKIVFIDIKIHSASNCEVILIYFALSCKFFIYLEEHLGGEKEKFKPAV